ncbi:Bacterial PH domain-containing protein [Bifidobacterium sp. DSM 109958]|uniref:Bacterial PH domain-containing protein n=1 Tax=Bifidobacterium moraviense TaxID=2675323 RepID=A0A7Y0HZF6_9BIFI|nr:PH domain-containing protein [Bifidobacterium sp. DSM 109958]NMN01357.1 Bacterial PH domain-containing protein [Bifidobacterium sp. DSM 109958]
MSDAMADGEVLWTQRKRNWCRTPFTFTTYTLTAEELAVKSGVLRETFDVTKLFRVVDMTITRTLLQRLFGLSTITLETRDQSSNGQTVLRNVIHGFEVRRIIQHAVDESRNVNRVSTREFMGDGYDGGDGGAVDGYGTDGYDADSPDQY